MRTYLIIFSFLSVGFCSAQTTSGKNLIRIETPKFLLEEEDTNTFYLPMGFNSADAKRTLSQIDASKIDHIMLVYTRYRLNDRFDQLALNNERTHALLDALPGIRSNSAIQWYWVAQTGCSSPSACSDYFHGFEIHLKPKAEEHRAIFETTLTSFYATGSSTDQVKLDSLIATETTPYKKICDTSFRKQELGNSILGSVVMKPKAKERRFYRKLSRLEPSPNIKFTITDRRKIINIEGIPEENHTEFETLMRNYHRFKNTRYGGKRRYTHIDMDLSEKKGKLSSVDYYATPLFKDGSRIDSFNLHYEYVRVIDCKYIDTNTYYSTPSFSTNEDVVTQVFDRNRDWKNCVVVTDVTGSMSPYMGQFLAWHKLNMAHTNNHEFIFFNDGDHLPDKLKRTGKVGGIYHIKTRDYTQLSNTLTKAQSKGGGGDAPENNIEAAIHALEKNPSASGIIMIADNRATPRDLSLLKQVNKPIHVILCGATGGVNIKYLNMAHANGGTVHTIEEDIENLMSLNVGDQVTISGKTYELYSDGFHKVSD